MFTAIYLLRIRCGVVAGTRSVIVFALASYNEDQVHRDTNTDHWHGVKQTSHQKGFGLQLWTQLWLTCSTFQQLTAQQSEADTSTQGTQPIMIAAAMYTSSI
jgi:hypothetical protein